jgi:four helix bundle protein
MGTFNFQSLDIYRVAKDVAVLVQTARIRDAELRDQATRAAKSAFLNLAEGLPSNQDGIRKRHFASCKGSLGELCAAVDLASALHVIDEAPAREIEANAERFLKMLQKL